MEIFEKLKNIKGIGFFIVGITLGLVLIFLGTYDKGKKADPPEVENVAMIDTESMDEYAKQLEKRITDLLLGINGINYVKVMVYLECSSEYIYAVNGESDVSSGNYVIVENRNGKKEPVLIKVVSPKVSGVAVVCNGGNNPSTQAKVKGVISALFNISSKNIFVSG